MAATKQYYGITLHDLIGAGLIKPSDEVTCEPRRGEVYRGNIGPSGEILLGGRTFYSPTEAAKTLAGNSMNGWDDIWVSGRRLREYRDDYLAGRRVRT